MMHFQLAGSGVMSA
ncbi:hypothetical protein, partial [Escherichia coli]